MDLLKAMENRHAVRAYTAKPIGAETAQAVRGCIERCNAEGGLHMNLVLNEPTAFSGFMAHYGKFSGVSNYVTVAGRKSPGLEERCGYYGEQVVLSAQAAGLNSCWVAMTYSKSKASVELGKDEKLCLVIALGYGETQGEPHKSKPRETVIAPGSETPDWFLRGVDAALLAPTAMNQQKFTLSCSENRVSAKAGRGFYVQTDLGIVKYHFELGAGLDNFVWA